VTILEDLGLVNQAPSGEAVMVSGGGRERPVGARDSMEVGDAVMRIERHVGEDCVSDKDEFVDVMSFEDLEPGRLKLVRAGAARVALCRIGSDVHAVSAYCTHAKIMLAPGRLDTANLIECPMHGAKFSPIDGSIKCGPATIPLGVHDVRVEGGRILVGTNSVTSAAAPVSNWGTWSQR
jgi:nitrite reductase/ring-hydroxylating ferredoxin subunit